jgi:hypothetical protein
MGRRKMTTQQFINRAEAVHGIKYDYTNTIFNRVDENITICCPIHGTFTQLASNHLRGMGCRQCAIKNQSHSNIQFIVEANKVHNNAYDYSNVVYTNCKTKVEIICPQHGIFFQTPNKHIGSKTGCPTCSGRPAITTAIFIQRSKKVHGDTYDYSKVKYISFTNKVEIICKQHGSFFQRPENHFRHRQGCPECKFEKARNNIGYYNELLFRCQPKLKLIPAWFYIVEFSNNNERFIKIGITIEEDVKTRLHSIPYKAKILQTTKLCLYEAFQLEQQIKNSNKHLKFKPEIHFPGWTECFKKEIQIIISQMLK